MIPIKIINLDINLLELIITVIMVELGVFLRFVVYLSNVNKV